MFTLVLLDPYGNEVDVCGEFETTAEAKKEILDLKSFYEECGYNEEYGYEIIIKEDVCTST